MDRITDGANPSPTERPFVEFADIIKRAIPRRKLTLLTKIRSDESWQSAAWLLERIHSDEFSRNLKVQTNQPVIALNWDGGNEEPETEATND